MNAADLGFFLEVLIGGLLSGVLYSLVALGVVLIFKASGVFNFAQGSMVLFAALSLVRLMEFVPIPVAILLAVAIMIAFAAPGTDIPMPASASNLPQLGAADSTTATTTTVAGSTSSTVKGATTTTAAATTTTAG